MKNDLLQSTERAWLSRRGLLKALGGVGGMLLFSSGTARLFDTASVKGQTGNIELIETVDFLELLDRPLTENVLKLFRAVADPVRNRVYVSGIMTRHIGILDGQSEEWIGTLDTGISGVNQKYLAVDSEANRLYVLDNSVHTLRAIDIETGIIIDPVSMPGSLGNLLPDPKRGLLYFVSRERPSFRAFDGATLNLAYSLEEMGEGISQMALDASANSLYLLDGAKTGPQGRIFQLDLETRSVIKTISFELPPSIRASALAFDETGRRLIVSVPNRVILILDADGNELDSIALSRELDFQQMLYNSENQRIYVASIELPADGRVAGVGSRLQVFDINDGRMSSDLSFGRKIHSMALNSATGKVYLPNGDASVVWSVAADAASVAPLRLGDSLEQVVYAAATGELYLNSRLGGNYLCRFAPLETSLETFTDGVWPIPIRTDSSGEHLFVLNAWDSTLSVYELQPSRRLLGTIALGLPAGSTDRLPDLGIDTTRKRAYAAYPEFGQIAVVDWEELILVQLITIDGIKTGDTGGGPGDLQVIVNEAAARLFVYKRAERTLNVYDVENGHKLVGEVRLAQRKDEPSGSNANLLYLDAARSRLFIGSDVLDATSGEPTGGRIERGQRVFAYDSELNAYWANAVETQGSELMAVLVAVDPVTLAARIAYELGPADAIPPEFAFDPDRRVIYMAQMISARLASYRV